MTYLRPPTVPLSTTQDRRSLQQRPLRSPDCLHGYACVDKFSSPEEFRDYFKAHYGPTIATYRSISEDLQRTAALDRGLARRHDLGTQTTIMDWEYLLLTARKQR
jgi:hypothetical protein